MSDIGSNFYKGKSWRCWRDKFKLYGNSYSQDTAPLSSPILFLPDEDRAHPLVKPLRTIRTSESTEARTCSISSAFNNMGDLVERQRITTRMYLPAATTSLTPTRSATSAVAASILTKHRDLPRTALHPLEHPSMPTAYTAFPTAHHESLDPKCAEDASTQPF